MFIILVLLFMSLGHFATDIYLPSLPAITRYFEIDNTYPQFTITAYMLSYSITPLIFGPLSDRVGRKPIVLSGLVIGTIASFGCAVAPNIWILILCRLFQGMGFGALTSGARAMIPDRYHGSTMVKYSSTLTMIMPVVLALAPPLGGFLQEIYSWRAPFTFLFIYTFVVLVFAIIRMPETNQKPVSKEDNKLVPIYLSLIKNINFIAYAVISASLFMGLVAYLTVSPYLFQDSLGLTPTQYGSISLISGTIVIIGSIINMHITKFFPPRNILYVSSGIMLISGISLFFLVIFNLVTVFSLMFICLLFFSALPITFPNAFASAFSAIKGNFGAAGASISCIQFTTGAITSAVLSYLPEKSAMPLALFYIFSGVVCLSMLLIVRHKNRVVIQSNADIQ